MRIERRSPQAPRFGTLPPMARSNPALISPARALAPALLISALPALLSGCGGSFLGFGESSGTIEARSLQNGSTYSPEFTTIIYRTLDANEADVLLTDMPVSRLISRDDNLADLSGNLVHVRMFLIPEAGMTPIDRTACNGTVRHAVFSSGAVGIYAGGGFVDPGSDPGDDIFSATIRNVSMRLSSATPGFVDRLGPTLLTGDFAATLDDKAAAALLDRLASLDRAIPHVQPKSPPKDAAPEPAAPPKSP